MANTSVCEVSKCEFRLFIDALFVFLSWDSCLHSNTPFNNGDRAKSRLQGTWSGTGRIMKQKLPVLRWRSCTVYLNSASEHGPKCHVSHIWHHTLPLTERMFDIGGTDSLWVYVLVLWLIEGDFSFVTWRFSHLQVSLGQYT